MKLEIGCGDKKIEGFTGIDNRNLDGVDIIHDIENIPWPIESDSCEILYACHIMEHITPRKIFSVMDEAWRVVKEGEQFQIKVPYGFAYEIDPSHTIKWNPGMFFHFDPDQKMYEVYKPKPWKVLDITKDTHNMQYKIALQKRSDT